MRPIVALLICSLLAAEGWMPVEVEATAFCPCKICCGERGVGITSTGVDTRDAPYGIAVDPKAIPYGTAIFIPRGYGYLDNQVPSDDDRVWYADDTGGAIIRDTRREGIIHIDLRFIHHANAKKFGRKCITVFLWE